MPKGETREVSVEGHRVELTHLDKVLYEDNAGAASTDPLLLYFDTFSSGMPVTPNGGNIVVVWNASGIFTF